MPLWIIGLSGRPNTLRYTGHKKKKEKWRAMIFYFFTLRLLYIGEQDILLNSKIHHVHGRVESFTRFSSSKSGIKFLTFFKSFSFTQILAQTTLYSHPSFVSFMFILLLIFQSSSPQQDPGVWALPKDRKSLDIHHDRGMIRDFHREAWNYLVVQVDCLAIKNVEAQNLMNMKPKKTTKVMWDRKVRDKKHLGIPFDLEN